MRTNLLNNDFDKFLAIIGVIASIILIAFSLLNNKSPVYTLSGILLFVFCFTWILLRKNIPLKFSQLNNNSGEYKFYITNIIFVVIFILLILSFYLRRDIYSRPIEYFIFTFGLVFIISLEILILKPSKNKIAIVLIQIILLGLSLEFSELLTFPTVVGIDPWYHQMFTLKIMALSKIPEGFPYSGLPIFHLGIVATSLLTGFNYKISAMLIWSTSQVLIEVLFIFLLGKFLFNKDIGLLAALLVIISTHPISMGFWLIPTTIAAIFIPIIIYLLFQMNNVKGIILAMFFMSIIILTHTIVSVAFAIILLVGWVSSIIYSKLYGNSPKKVLTLGLSLLFICAMLSWWIYASGYAIEKFAQIFSWGFSIDYFLHAPSSVLSYRNNVPLSEQIFNNLGVLFFFSFSLWGCFYMISKEYGDSKKFSITFMSLIPLVIAYSSLITNHSVVEHRWWYISQILLSIPLAVSIFLLTNLRIKLNKVFPILIIVFMSLLMIMNPLANVDNHIFSPNTGVTYGFTTSEMNAAFLFSQKSSNGILTDDNYLNVFSNYYNVNSSKIKLIDNSLYNKKFSQDEQIKIIRKNIIKNPFNLFGVTYKLDYDPTTILNPEFNKIYDSNTVTAYL